MAMSNTQEYLGRDSYDSLTLCGLCIKCETVAYIDHSQHMLHHLARMFDIPYGTNISYMAGWCAQCQAIEIKKLSSNDTV